MQQIALRDRALLDIGTGSGVLAITAARLGARPVLGIDDDPDALASARDNLALNPDVDITLGALDFRRAHLRPADVVVANLTGALLISGAAALAALGRHQLLLSGFLADESEALLAAYPGWHVEHRAQEDEWGALILTRPIDGVRTPARSSTAR